MTARLPQWCGSGLTYREGGKHATPKAEGEEAKTNAEFARGDSDADAVRLDAGNGVAFGFGSDADKSPAEVLTVELLNRDAPRTGTTLGAPSLAGFVVTTPSLAQEAATLAYMRGHRHDIRPDLLLFVMGEDMSRLPHLLDYGERYALWWALREGWQGCAPGALRAAAAHALSQVLWRTRFTNHPHGRPKARVASYRVCAARVGMNKDRFGEVVRVLVAAYLLRLREARDNYARAERG